MVTVVKTPEGHKIIDQAVTAAITEDYIGDAVVTLTGHSLSTGAVVYITSDLDEYNGFWYVTVITADTFKISEHSAADFVEYYQDADIEYYQTQPHDWSSIFLPIVYKVTNDKWPTNTVDSVNLIVLNADDNGFTELTLAAPVSANALEFIKLSGASEEANGVWQIIEVVVSNVIVINLPYELSGNLIGKTIQYYYNNYQVKVKIFSGLPVGHPWYAKKPYAEVAELSLTPDENNEVMFSVADYIQGQVSIRNNPTLFSMPLNLDAFTGFYIATGETYDQSDNYSLYTTDALFEDDDFEGYAIAGKLPFKNVYSGDYADYVYTSGSPAQWLTNRARLLAVEGYYFDVSFIKNIVGDFVLSINKYITSDYYITELIDFIDQGIGVYRVPITTDANYESFCVKILAASEGIVLDNSEFQNNGGLGDPWTTGSSPSVSVTFATQTEILYDDYSFVSGIQYNVTLNFSVVGTATVVLSLRIYDNTFAVQFGSSGGTNDETPITVSFIATELTTRIGIDAFSSAGSQTITIESITVSSVSLQLVEEICIDILESCEIEGGFTPDTARRLTEDGGYRLLE